MQIFYSCLIFFNKNFKKINTNYSKDFNGNIFSLGFAKEKY